MARKIMFFLMAVFLLGVSPALALTVCQPGDVGGATECRDGVPDTPNDSAALLNSNGFFGFTDWKYISKYDVDEDEITGEDIGLTVEKNGGWHSGTYSFSASLWNMYENIVIVLKDGGIVVDATPEYTLKWFAYLLETGANEGDWTYPEYGRYDDKDLSHLTIYARGTATVPEPATMLLLGTGMIGLAWTGRKKQIK